jgi:iron transport multicopper oxidase
MFRYHLPSLSAGKLPTANSTLINGLGRYSGGPSSPLSVINVQPNKRYRMRLVAISCEPNYVFSIDSHNMVSILRGARVSLTDTHDSTHRL